MADSNDSRRWDGLRELLFRKVHVLLLLVPAAWALALVTGPSAWLFAAAAGSILPLAGLIRHATDALAARTGPALGGFLNASFGNAAELIIGIAALRAGHNQLVQASLSGSIIGNLLVVLGLAMFVGGLRHGHQRFNRRSAGNATAMLFLAVVALVMPAIFDLTVSGSVVLRSPEIVAFSLWTSALLVVAYAGGLIYTFRARRDPFRPEEEDAKPALGVTAAVAALAAATLVTTVQAELLVSALEPMLQRFGLTELFTGVIVVALVGNAAEHYSAVHAGAANRMSLATHIAIGSSAQIALLVAPALVLVSLLFGEPMTLLFHPLEIAGIGLSVLAVAIVSLDGESNWVEGLQLLAVYLVLAAAFYLVPA
ncbi:MAG: CaCA family calcium/proton antiporter [Acidobacteria bacterium]|nr:CaCA family calcium/proton antiporter [Acidobacteriota bacterium]